MEKKILIIGGTGFLGFNLCKYYQKKKFNVLSISRFKPDFNKKIKKVKYICVDISNKKFLEIKIKKYIKNVDYVINASGSVDHKNFNKVYKSHYLGVKNISKYFLNKKIKKFIQIGSSMEYGKLKSPQIEMLNTNPLSFYGYAKFKSTNYLLRLYKLFNFPVVILRLYQVYGPYQEQNRLIPFVINNCLSNKKFPVSKGNQLRDFMYIQDFLEATNKVLLKKNTSGHIFNIGSGKPIKVKSLINFICKFIKKGAPVFGKILFRKEESMSTYPDIKKIKKEINWAPKIKFKNGIIKTIKFYRKLV